MADEKHTYPGGGVRFVPIVLHAGERANGERNTPLLASEVIDPTESIVELVKATTLVSWVEESPHPQAGQKKPGATWDRDAFPEIIRATKTEPREVLIAVVGRSHDAAIALMQEQLEQCRAALVEQSAAHAAAEQRAREADGRANALSAQVDGLKMDVDRARDNERAERKARVECSTLIRELQAHLEAVKRKIGEDAFKEAITAITVVPKGSG